MIGILSLLFTQAFAAPMTPEDAIILSQKIEAGEASKWSTEATKPGAKVKKRPIVAKKSLFTELDKPIQTKLVQKASSVVDLRKFSSGIRDQGQRGWCTSFATVATIENLFNQKIKQQSATARLNLSEAHLWSLYKQYSMWASTAAATKYYVTTEAAWPYYGTPKSNYLLSAKNKYAGNVQINSLNNVLNTLDKGIPVVMGVDTTPYWGNPNKGIIPIAGTIEGGHAIAVEGYIRDTRVSGGGLLIFKNSWSSRWGDVGYGYLPFGYCAKYDCYFIAPTGVVTK